MDPGSMIILTSRFFLHALKLGFDPIWLVSFHACVEIGMITPPVG
jgi:TRAP-type C4-dicarboxylate transport system permease large subunit